MSGHTAHPGQRRWPARFVRRFLSPPEAMLHRVQWTIMVAGTVQVVLALPLLVAERSQTNLHRIAGLIAMVALVRLWHRTSRRQEVPAWAPLVEVPALLAIALATGGLTSSNSIFYTNLWLRPRC